MLNELTFGQTVKIWPTPGQRVVFGPGGSDLPADGAEVMWNEWWFARAREGAIRFHATTAAPVVAEPEMTLEEATSNTDLLGESLAPLLDDDGEPVRFDEPPTPVTEAQPEPIKPSTPITRS